MELFYILVCSEKTGRKYVLDGRGYDYISCFDWISRHKRKGFIYGVYPKNTIKGMDKIPPVKYFKESF